MNKLTKGAIAGAAGIVLLMGGAGSLAYWNDSANAGPTSGTTITAGTLSISNPSAGSWTRSMYNGSNVQTVAPAAVSNLSAVRIVPGNRLVYTQTFDLNASGDNLYFTLTNTAGTVAAPSSPTAADTALVSQINASANNAFTVTSSTGNIVLTGTTPGVYRVSGTGTTTITVTWTIDFPFGSSVVNTAKGGVVSLQQGAITVTQVAAP